MYPEDTLTAEIIGTRVIQTGDYLNLQNKWYALGANMDFVANDHLWSIDGLFLDTPAINHQMFNPGDYELYYTFTDFLDRDYDLTTTVRVLNPDDFNLEIAAPQAAMFVLTVPGGITVYIPVISKY